MHEFSIVNALLEMCEKNAKEHNASKITKVEIKVGKLSGVIRLKKKPYVMVQSL